MTKYTLEEVEHSGIIYVYADGVEIARSIDHHNAEANAEVKAALEALVNWYQTHDGINPKVFEYGNETP
jgi:hypothetical protein